MKQTRRSALKTVASAGALFGLGGVGSAAARDGARGEDTLVDVAVAADGFDVLVAAVTEAGLVDVLDGNRQLTVFAPTDDAFDDAGITVENVGDLDEEFLVDVLTYHVSPGRRYAESVVGAPRLPTLNGAAIGVEGTVLNDGQAEIIDTDVEASNGVIHVIDGVLLP
ncbi:MAG: fasciclin domain-containing protein [Haloferacaceae archaeon]